MDGPTEDAVTDLFAPYTPAVRDLAVRTRALVRSLIPDATEEIDTNPPLLGYTYRPGTYKGLILAIMPRKAYLNVIFSKGVELLELDSVGLPVAVGLLILARGLAGGRRLAHRLLLGLVPVWLVASAGTGPLVSRSARWLLGLAVLGALLALRHDVPARPHPRRLRTASQVAGAGLAVAVAHAGWLAAVTAGSPVTSGRVALAPLRTGLVAARAAVVAVGVGAAPPPAPPPADPPGPAP